MMDIDARHGARQYTYIHAYTQTGIHLSHVDDGHRARGRARRLEFPSELFLFFIFQHCSRQTQEYVPPNGQIGCAGASGQVLICAYAYRYVHVCMCIGI